MPSRTKPRESANSTENTTLNVNEKILKECHRLYTEEDKGLIPIAASVGIELLAPRKKITIMLMGNHSAGKSSFVNWYVEEHIQKTGVAIETQGFTIVTSGKKRESLLGNATFHLFSHLKPLQELEGVPDYLTTEISTSKQKKFGLVMFVDTPGLVDGDMAYPFDVNQSIEYLGSLCDLIFVFFDPIGQALCKRTLNIVENLNNNASDRIKFYLSKADTAGSESDRQRVLMQITQELCKRPGLNKCGFDMPTIFVPSLIDRPARCENQIESVCKEIDKTINQTIQNTLNKFEQDCDNVSVQIEKVLEEDRSQGHANFKATLVGWFLFSLATCLGFLLSASFVSLGFLMKFKEVEPFLVSLEDFWKKLPTKYEFQTRVTLGVCVAVLMIASKLFFRKKETLSRKVRRLLQEKKVYVETNIKTQKVKLYNEYLQQSISDGDL
jgi:GTPase SAR1 family protein